MMDLSDDAVVANALLEHLRAVVAPSETMAEPPEAMRGGFDNAIYAFRLSGVDGDWAKPLVLRVYRGATDPSAAFKESAAQEFCAARGVPTVRALHACGPDNPFGMPLMVLPRIDGRTMADQMVRSPSSIGPWIRTLAVLQQQIHELPPDESPLVADGALVDRRLAEFDAALAPLDVEPRLHACIDWLRSRRDVVVTEEASVLHHDIHPLNVLIEGGKTPVVIDWTNATVGDAHADVAWTSTTLWVAPLASAGLERAILRLARPLLLRTYRRAWIPLRQLDARRVDYWSALHLVFLLIGVEFQRQRDESWRREELARVLEGRAAMFRRFDRLTRSVERGRRRMLP